MRQQVRVKMLSIMKETVITNILMYEDKLIEVAVLPHLSGLEAEIDRSATYNYKHKRCE